MFTLIICINDQFYTLQEDNRNIVLILINHFGSSLYSLEYEGNVYRY